MTVAGIYWDPQQAPAGGSKQRERKQLPALGESELKGHKPTTGEQETRDHYQCPLEECFTVYKVSALPIASFNPQPGPVRAKRVPPSYR